MDDESMRIKEVKKPSVYTEGFKHWERMMLSLLMSLSVFHWADSFRFAEALGEIAWGGKTKDAGYLRKGKICIGE